MLSISFREISDSCLLDCDRQPRAQVSEFGFFPFEEPQAGARTSLAFW